MKKRNLAFLTTLALLPIALQPSVVLASTSNNTESNYTELSVTNFKPVIPASSMVVNSQLPKYKEKELSKLAKDTNLSTDEMQFLKNQYLENHATNQFEVSKWKVSVAKKAVKVAVPIIKKYAKKAGIKIAQHQLDQVINIITGVEDNVQGRLEKALRNMGFSKGQAGMIARAIMFVLF